MVSKKGISDVVSTVLIILLVVAAIAVLGSIVLRTINQSSLKVGSSVSCQEVQVVPTSCAYSNGATPTVLVNRKDGVSSTELSNLTFIFSKGTAAETKEGINYPGVLEVKSYTIGTATEVYGGSLSAAIESPDYVQVAVTITDSAGRIAACSPSLKISCTNTGTVVPPVVVNAPTGFAVSGGGSGNVDFDWYDNSVNEAGFVIENRPSGDIVWHTFETYSSQAGTGSYNSVIGATCSGDNDFRVYAYLGSIKSGYSSEFNAVCN